MCEPGVVTISSAVNPRVGYTAYSDSINDTAHIHQQTGAFDDTSCHHQRYRERCYWKITKTHCFAFLIALFLMTLIIGGISTSMNSSSDDSSHETNAMKSNMKESGYLILASVPSDNTRNSELSISTSTGILSTRTRNSELSTSTSKGIPSNRTKNSELSTSTSKSIPSTSTIHSIPSTSSITSVTSASNITFVSSNSTINSVPSINTSKSVQSTSISYSLPSTSTSISISPTSTSEISASTSSLVEESHIYKSSNGNPSEIDSIKLFNRTIENLFHLLPCKPQPQKLSVKRAISHDTTNLIHDQVLYPEVVVVMRCDHMNSYCGNDNGMGDSSKRCISSMNETKTHTIKYHNIDEFVYKSINIIEHIECKCMSV